MSECLLKTRWTTTNLFASLPLHPCEYPCPNCGEQICIKTKQCQIQSVWPQARAPKSAWINLSPVIIMHTVESVHLRFATLRNFYQKSHCSFHLNVHTILKLPNLSNKHIFWQRKTSISAISNTTALSREGDIQWAYRASPYKDRAAHCISPTWLSAVVFDGKSQMHTLYCTPYIILTGERRNQALVRAPV